MKFLLEGEIKFNKEAEDAYDDIKNFIEYANEGILTKGAKERKDGAKIIDWKLSEDKLFLKIESGHKVRSHDAILRVKKPLAELIGKKYHLGIREINIIKYEIDIPLETDENHVDVETLESVAKTTEKLSSFEIQEDDLKLVFENIDESGIRKQSINRLIKLILASNEEVEDDKNILTNKVIKGTPGEVVGRSPEFEYSFDGDVNEKAMELGWIKRFTGKGQWFYGPKMTALQRALEGILLEEVVEKLDFQECLFPKLIPFQTMDKMKYFEGLPEGMYYCCAPKRDPVIFNQFKNELVITKDIPVDLLKQGLKDPSYVLAPAQCEPFYEFLSHEVVDEAELPIKFYDKSGWTYRWEGGGAKGFDRVHEFQRIEMVWLDIPENTNKIRDQTLKLSEDIATELELEWYTEIGDDPFYLEGRKVEERGIEFPDIPKYEMRLTVPGVEKGVAIVSANVHGTHFTEGFTINEAHKHTLWTGCTGLGLTRWIYGFLSQKGFNKENWPDRINERIKDVKVPKILTWPRE